jgi:hypothetical protein
MRTRDRSPYINNNKWNRGLAPRPGSELTHGLRSAQGRLQMATPNECHSLFSTQRNDSLIRNTICSVGALPYFRREGSWQSRRRPNSSAELFHRSTTSFRGEGRCLGKHKYGRHPRQCTELRCHQPICAGGADCWSKNSVDATSGSSECSRTIAGHSIRRALRSKVRWSALCRAQAG